MIRYNGLKINIKHDESDIINAINKKLRTKNVFVRNYSVYKKSLDARDKNNIHWNYIIDLTTDNDALVLKNNKGRKEFSTPGDAPYRLPLCGQIPYDIAEHGRVCVIGSGPAGLFCAYMLAKTGFMPLLIERGESVEDRLNTVSSFWEGKRHLDPDSNVQFGEGGAGTFSDGKLHTGVKDKQGRNALVLSIFEENGANEDILYDNKAHLGTDELTVIVKNMREMIIECGGEVLFNSRFTELVADNEHLKAIKITNTKTGAERVVKCENLVLAIGHSARDTFGYLIDSGLLDIEAKPFACGVRIQHLQDDINIAQYGREYKNKYGNALPPADYKLVTHTEDNEAVYSFCMCPGGYVINSSSEDNRLCVNGMSYSDREGENANSAIVMSVKPSDDPMTNIEYQRRLEEKAYMAGSGDIPIQRFEDFELHKVSDHFGRVKPAVKGRYNFADLNDVFDEHYCEELKKAIHLFAEKIENFNDKDALLCAVESRTSSPVRILRNEHYEARIKGVFPCGEGAGYAGGITSAAIDGIKIFEEIHRRYNTTVVE